MNYKSFWEFSKSLREGKETPGTSSILSDRTGDHKLQRTDVHTEPDDQRRTGHKGKQLYNCSL